MICANVMKSIAKFGLMKIEKVLTLIWDKFVRNDIKNKGEKQ